MEDEMSATIPPNPIQMGSIWKDKSGNLWEVVRLLPGGKVELFDRQRVWFTDKWQYQIRAGMADGSFTLNVQT